MDAVIILVAQYFYMLVLAIGAVFFFTQPNVVRKSMLICGIIIAPLAYVLSRIAGYLYYNPRPFVVGDFTPLIAHAADNGFPSDHVLLTAAVAMIVWFYNKKLSVVLWSLAILIGVARVLAGVHHVADILGSVLLVLISGIVYYLAVGRSQPRKL
ncbi:MAG: phosphatase PAP2 family protein [Patescibacteria group bacterium]|nr:phosphatase PAP2 family protein [Patescibacteria group bacterium]MCL5224419.1 phosphatase PAP2 family protein [Patescibacteria group bacterium]